MLDIHNQFTSLLTEHERLQILFDWNATERAYPYEQCLHQLFEAQVARTPHASAALFENSRLTYHELNACANQLAHYLLALGVGPDVLVGVYMERSLEMIIGLLGILKAGGAYVPLDPTYPSERVGFMLEDMATVSPEPGVGASPCVRPRAGEQGISENGRMQGDAPTQVSQHEQLIVLAQPHLIGQLPEHNARVICFAIENENNDGGSLRFIDGEDEIAPTQETSNPLCAATANNLAYVIYTSGSTGKPKGAMNTHRGICNRLLWMQDAYQLTSADAVLQKTPFSFDVSVWEFFWPLLTGARLVIARPEGHKDSAYLLALIQQQQITTLHFVPSMFQVFLEEPGLEACSSLRQVICSGESLPYALQERFFARHPAALYNLYGPTEAAIDVTHWTCQRNSKRHIVPIGYPIANTQLYILNDAMELVPIGEQGELYIGGVGVARGYLNRPALTAERFVHDPFSSQPDARLYRTGDIARYLPDGAIECLGRLDQQVKLRGFRIELGEIEAVLAHHAVVREAVVTLYEDTPGNKRLIAYVVFHTGLHATIAELQNYMQQHVPPYMVPSLFVELPAFPLTSSGKVDRRALPTPDHNRPDLKQPFIAPRTELEEIIADAWTQVLGVHQVGIDDNFFALGGHSLLAMRVTTLLRTILQVELPLRTFFAAPTVAQFAEQVSQLKNNRNVLPLPPLQALPREIRANASSPSIPQDAIVLPASFAQQRFWFMDQLDPNNPAYNIPATMHFHGQLDRSALQRSLTEITQRHEVLRTTFVSLNGQPMQVITPTLGLGAINLGAINLGAINLGAINRAPTLAEEAARPFDLAQGPLWRVSLFRSGPEDYVLFLLIHHSIADGWSIGLFFQELTTLYTAFSTGQPSTLPALPIQYADFAAWQRASLQEEQLAEHLRYWQRQLAGAPEMLELPTDFSRPLVPTHQGATYTFALSSQLTESLKVLSRQEGVTLYITLVAAFQLLLHRYTGQGDLIIGTAAADRAQPEVQGLLGLFLNTVVLRTHFSGDPTVQELLARVREVVLDAHAHQDLPFERLVQELNLQRSNGQSPLFQVSLQLDPSSPVTSTAWTLTRMSTGTGATKFDLSLELDDHPDGLIGHLEYSTDLFTEPTIVRMATHWQTLLENMVANPTQTVAFLPMLTENEQHHLLVELNNTSIPYPAEECLHELIEAQAKRTPSDVAAIFEDSQLTYQELNARSNQFAHYLQSLGVGPDILVGICSERSLDMLVALLGILKAGGAYLPLDPSYPAERIAFMLDDAKVGVLVTQQSLVATGAIRLAPTDTTRVVCIDTDRDSFLHLSAANLTTSISPSHLAYVIYTSGSTGRPKGVQITHRALVNFLLSMCQEPGITPQDTLLAVTTLSFDIAGLELYLPLIVGAQLVIASRDVATSGIALAETLARTHTTIMQATPITWRMLLSTGWQADPYLKILCGGEALPLELARQLTAEGAPLYNMYGPTETTIWSTLHKFEPEDTSISIGHPIANTTIYILDQHLQLVPMGVPGELYIGGDGLARGYLNRPELTAERFIRHPFSSNPVARLYRTGDLARYRRDGTIELIGRVDHQIKLRGFRIELGEIESVLEQHSAVQQAVAIVREDRPGDKRLVAYLLLRDGQSAPVTALQQHARALLPDYMLPSFFVVLDQLPQTPNGKVDRRALPAPDQVRSDLQESKIAPRTPLETIVANVWSQVLGIAHIGIHDNFFALGGHSLLIMQITAQLYKALQVDLPLRSFFEAPTVAQLAELIVQANGSSRAPLALRPLSREALPNTTLIFPTSSAQQALWFIHLLDASNAAYNLPVTLLIHKPLHIETLKQSLNVLVQRHEALRTTFAVVDEQSVQLVALHIDIPITIKDLQHAPLSEQTSAVQHLAMQELQRPFDLEQGPLVRACILQLASEEHILLLVLHHSISDGWSINLLLQELVTLYEAHLGAGMLTPLPDLALQFGDFATWQREWLQSEMFSEHLSYWKHHLAGAPTTLALPADRPRPTQPTFKGAMHTFTLSSELSSALKTLSNQENVTLYMTLVAAFLTLLQRYSGQDDLLLGTTTAGRTFAETQPLLGYFINTLVLRNDLSGNPTVRDLLGRVREVVLAADAHQHLPFDILVKELQPDRSQGQSPLFQVFLTLDPPLPELAPGYDPTQLDLATGAAKFDLSLELADRPTGIVGHFEYSTDLFNASTIARMAGHWKTLLHAMVNDPASSLSTLSLLTDAERQQILFDWNDTHAVYPRAATIPQLFEAQAEHTPNAKAITFNAISLSYQNLNREANQFAHYLQKRGIKPGARIALCYERSHELIVALLGILKAGGIYVPLDPAYPSERLTFMLEDSHANALVTQQSLLERLGLQRLELPGRGVTLRAPADQEQSSSGSGRTQGDAPTLVRLDREWQAIRQESPENLPGFVSGEDPAYMLYTSGSTGIPKGVLGTHRAALNRFNWMWRTYPFASGEVCCQKTTLSFVDSVWEIFGPLLQGIQIVIIPDGVVKDPQLFLQALAAHSVTRIVLVPSLLRVLLDNESSLKARIPDLKYWICSGETLPLELVQRFEQQMPASILLNLYGSSEVAADATCYEIKKVAELSCVPIGRPIDNTQIYLLDRNLQLVPVGIPGELYVGGDGLALGYFNRPELTATKFVHHPFSNQPEARLYKTGDWARYLLDGTLEYLGRLDHQVKIRGIRIELGEIESVLSKYPMIHEAVVSVREDAPGDKRIIAYVVFHAGKTTSNNALRQYLGAHLPAYMLPSIYIYLDTLPLTPNGKVDRRALPAPDATHETVSANYIAPHLTVHLQLVQLWEELLNIRPIGIRDDFFALGGHSFLAVRLMARIEQVCGKKLPLSILFQGATIEHLANMLQVENQADTTRTPITPIQTGGTKRPFFFLHGDWQGKGLYCLKLAQVLGADQPFYVLETYKYHDLNVLPTLQEVAAAHIAAIRAIQPEGPYTLGGWCNGALFAYEMAQQLQRAGQQVDTLVLMDPGSSTFTGRLFSRAIQRVSHLFHLQEGQQLDYFLRFLHLYEYVRLWNDHKKHAAIQSRTESTGDEAEVEAAHPNFQSPLPSRANLRQNYISVFSWWASPYKIEPYVGRIAVFWTEGDGAKRRKDWERILAGKKDVEVYMVPGTHVTSRTKYAESLARSLRDCLDNSDGERGIGSNTGL